MMLDELADCFDFAYLLSRGRLSLAQSPRGIFSKKITQRPISDLLDGATRSLSASLACSESSDASRSLGSAPPSKVSHHFLVGSLATDPAQAVVVRLLVLLSNKTRNRLTHALNGNGAKLVGSKVLAASFLKLLL